MNPLVYKENYINPLYKKTAKEKWHDDKIKQTVAEDTGFKYLVIWEHEFKQNETETIERCIKFLNE